MVEIVKTVLNVGLQSPVKLLHITDVHLTEISELDTEWQREQMAWRKELFVRQGGNPPLSTNEYFKEAMDLADELGATLVLTGDVFDLYTKGNVKYFRETVKGRNIMYSPGGHEYQKQYVPTMEEPDGYGKMMHEVLKKDIPEFDLDFESRIIGGVNVITANNGLDYYNEYTVKRFEEELERGYPIIVFSHDPLTDRRMLSTTKYHPNVELTDEEFAISHRMMDAIFHDDRVITSFTGHNHKTAEYEIDGKLHYVTDGLFRGICRLIEIV